MNAPPSRRTPASDATELSGLSASTAGAPESLAPPTGPASIEASATIPVPPLPLGVDDAPPLPPPAVVEVLPVMAPAPPPLCAEAAASSPIAPHPTETNPKSVQPTAKVHFGMHAPSGRST